MAIVSEVFATFLDGAIVLRKLYDDKNNRVQSMRGVNSTTAWRATIIGQLGNQRVVVDIGPGEDKTQDLSGVFGTTAHDQVVWAGSFERI